MNTTKVVAEHPLQSATQGRLTNRHTWTPAEEDLLRHHVVVVLGAHDSPQTVSRARRGPFWDRVAGRFLPDLDVTSQACRERWAVLRERDAELERAAERERLTALAEAEPQVIVTPDTWERVAALVSEYEQDQADRLEALVVGLHDSVLDLAAAIGMLQAQVSRIEGL